MYGRAVAGQTPRRDSVASNYTTANSDIGGEESITRSQFVISLYVDVIHATTPALIVWNFRKDAKVRLGELQPQFTASRGFFGVRTTACTENSRPYYACNVIKFIKKERVKDTEHPTVKLTFCAFYDDDGMVRSKFDLTIVALHNGADVVTSLVTMRLTLHNSSLVLGERDLSQVGRQRGLPAVMFTPQVFKSIPHPDVPALTWSASRSFVNQVWLRLGEINATDWERYILARNRFATEYGRHIRAAHW